MSNWSLMARQILLDNSLTSWFAAALAFLLSFTVLPLVRSYARARRRARYAEREPPMAVALIGYLLDHTSRVVLWIVGLYAAERILTLPPRLDRLFEVAIVLGCWLQLGLWGAAAARFGLQRQQARSGNGQLGGTIDVVLFAIRLLVWIVVVLLALENLGVNVGPLIAGLGVGGIAIALAVQAILGDLFASLSIALDKPFVIGDTLRIDIFEGAVEQIGIKSTRLRSVSGEQIIIANADLLKSRVRNLGRASERRALFTLWIAYETPVELLDQVPKLVTEAIASYPGTRFVHCLLKELGDSALLFEVCFFVQVGPGRDLNAALDQVNRHILRTFRGQGIDFAHPARTVLLRDGRAAAVIAAPAPAPAGEGAG
ncbi:MAG: mechanosensitive ion channel family protein [Steroidobacteraceae bacterium]|jgi:small-conductance mechanosensitive channel